MNVLGAGRAILYREPGWETFHLWLILSDPLGDPPRVVAVMVRTAKDFTDDTVVLDEGDHPFVRHPSSVHYSTADLFEVRALLAAIEKGHCHLREDMSRKLLTKVRRGLIESPFTRNRLRLLCEGLFT